ncbi:MAG TPA: hypothetical protein VHK47_02070, partial [Polyangia bacterium]|nr:hypothetical protein [Polyangia bacterium]
LLRQLTGRDGIIARALDALGGAPERHRTLVGVIGRRGLKSSGIVAWCAAYEALCVDHGRHAQPGSRLHFVLVAPSMRQAAETLRGVRIALDGLAGLGVKYAERQNQDRAELTITAPAGRCERVVTVMAASDVRVRGFAVPFYALDECAFLRSDIDNVSTDREVVAALSPGQLTFPDARAVLVSSPGPTGSLMHELSEKPTAGTLVVRAPSWIANDRITEAACRALARDERHFEQEFAARRWGAAGESFIDEDDVRACVDAPACSRGPRSGAFAVGLDVGLVHDATAIVVCGAHLVEPAPGKVPIRHVVVEHAEQHRGTRAAPLSLPALLDRVAAVAKRYGRAKVRADQHIGPEVERGLRERGIACELVPMHPQAQERRWNLLAQLVRGRRLHLPEDRELVRQLGALKVTQLASGAHRVEGKRDDLADALALAVEHAADKLEPNGDGGIECITPVWCSWTADGGVRGLDRTWRRRLANGTYAPMAPPLGTIEGDQAREWRRAQGLYTPEDLTDEAAEQSFNVRVHH